MNKVPESDSVTTSKMNMSDSRIVTTQDDLDQALADGVGIINIRSEPKVWLRVGDTGSSLVQVSGSSIVDVWGFSTVQAEESSTVHVTGLATVQAGGSTSVHARGSASVTAWGSATVKAGDRVKVEARGSASVTAWDSATVNAAGDRVKVEAWDSSSVEVRGSATVQAHGYATVLASGSATVRACGSSTVEASDSTSITAWESASVSAGGSASVRAWDSSSVHAWSFATIRASSHVIVHRHSDEATISGGIVIDHTQKYLDPLEWCAWHDVPVTEGKALLHKAVGDVWTTESYYDYQPVYSPGSVLEAPDWIDDNNCGGGLHFSPRPWEARSYYLNTTHFVVVEVDVADLRPILGLTPKAKAPRCRVLYEVDVDGNPLEEESIPSS